MKNVFLALGLLTFPALAEHSNDYRPPQQGSQNTPANLQDRSVLVFKEDENHLTDAIKAPQEKAEQIALSAIEKLEELEREANACLDTLHKKSQTPLSLDAWKTALFDYPKRLEAVKLSGDSEVLTERLKRGLDGVKRSEARIGELSAELKAKDLSDDAKDLLQSRLDLSKDDLSNLHKQAARAEKDLAQLQKELNQRDAIAKTVAAELSLSKEELRKASECLRIALDAGSRAKDDVQAPPRAPGEKAGPLRASWRSFLENLRARRARGR